MIEFLQTSAGKAVFGVLIAAIIIVIIDLNYRLFTKVVLDFLIALSAVLLLSPVLAVCAIISKRRASAVTEKTAYLGYKGKIIYLSSFAGINNRLKYLPRLFNVLSGKLSFVGVKPMRLSDGAFMDDNSMERFNARPGIVCSLALNGFEEMTYEESFGLDIRYVKRRELFTDIFILIKRAVTAVRGESAAFLGETAKKSYSQILLERGAVTQSDIKRAEALAAEAVEESEKRANILKEKYN